MNIKRLLPLILLILIVLIIHNFNNSTPQSQDYKKNSGFVFGTMYNFTYQADSDLSNAILARLATYDSALSVYNPASLLSRLNESDSVLANNDLLYVINQAKHFNALSRGAFDITVEPLSRIWRFTKNLADDTISVEKWNEIAAQVNDVMPLIGIDKISTDGNIIRKADPRMKLNANALAEGFGIDLAAQVLEENGVENYLVEIGGEIHCKGLNPHGKKWSVGINRPIESSAPNSGNQCIIEVSNCAVSTSGNYRQCYHVADGRLVQHTIDPRTGFPVSHSMKSVTCVGPNTLTTDALCTTLMVAGPDSALQVVARFPNVEAYIIFQDSLGTQREAMTTGFSALIRK